MAVVGLAFAVVVLVLRWDYARSRDRARGAAGGVGERVRDAGADAMKNETMGKERLKCLF